jgi:LCP family protein required for cell wall assembly
MSEWPEGWFRDGQGDGGSPPGPGSAEPTAHLPAGAGAPGGAGQAAFGQDTIGPGPGPAGSAGTGAGAGAVPGAAGPGTASGWPQQPPISGGGPRQPARRGTLGRPGFGGWRGWLRPRRIIAVLAVLVSLVLVFTVGMYFFLDSKLHRVNVLVNYSGRPAASAGVNWLIAGSDSRQGLSVKEERKLATGFDVSGQRSDTIMVLHVPANGGPSVLVSLPRDSYVPIPGYGYNKINAAFSFGGPKLLAETVQNVTGLRIDHYMEIGFGGFVNVVNAVGGVRMCLLSSLNDPDAGLHLHKGCQTLNGDEALGYVRTRHRFADQDLQRVQDQRLFLRALLSKVTSAGVMLNPFSSIPAAIGVADTLTVDQGTSLYQLIEVAFALRHPETTTVPIANPNYITADGDAVQWNPAQASRLFNALKNDQPVPKSLLTGSRQAT